MLKSSGCRIDPCGIPESRVLNILWTSLMFTDCFGASGMNTKK